tara:strand:+ start:264 stop:1040 length:777 start_codon:yes stop_codon:yes gene_type:complete
MPAIELARSRSYHRTTGGEEQTYVYQIPGRPVAAKNTAGIPQIGDELVGQPDLICVDVKSDFHMKNQDDDYALVIVRYSTEQPLLVNPGDMKFDYDFTAKTEQVSFAPRVVHTGHRYPDNPAKDMPSDPDKFVKRPVGQFGDTMSRYVPNFTLRVTKLYDKVGLSAEWAHLYDGAGKVNHAPWNGNIAYSMLFLGGSVPQTGKNRWTGTFNFAFDEGLHDYPWFKIDTKTQQVEGEPYWSERYLSYNFDNLNMAMPTE